MTCLGMFDKSKKAKEDVVDFYLAFDEEEDQFRFFAVDKDGNRIVGGSLFYFDKASGLITTCGAITTNLGFDLTENGELRVE